MDIITCEMYHWTRVHVFFVLNILHVESEKYMYTWTIFLPRKYCNLWIIVHVDNVFLVYTRSYTYKYTQNVIHMADIKRTLVNFFQVTCMKLSCLSLNKLYMNTCMHVDIINMIIYEYHYNTVHKKIDTYLQLCILISHHCKWV